MESLGHEGLNKMLDGFEDRGAEAVCTFAFCRGPGEEPIIFQGRTAVSLYFGFGLDWYQGRALSNVFWSFCDSGLDCSSSWPD